jgi:hypothetical protein
VSVEALAWALNLAPIPVDGGGKQNSACAFVLVALANHADSDGTGAFPSADTIVRYTRLSERTVRTAIDRLADARVIRPCAPEIVAARIHRADRRPQGWDLDLTLVRDDLTDADIVRLERQFPGLRARIDSTRADAQTPVCAADGGVQPLHPAPDGPVDNSPHGVQSLHLVRGAGCSERTNGVQLTPPRGAAAAPEPSIEPSRNSPAASVRAREGDRPPVESPAAGGGSRLGEFFDVLGAAWRLSPSQRSRLAPAVCGALGAGWQPEDLAAFVGANTVGVRSPYAVLAARLVPGELPAPPAPAARRKPWCGICDERTRLLIDEFTDGMATGRARRCPDCGGAQPVVVRRSPATSPTLTEGQHDHDHS